MRVVLVLAILAVGIPASAQSLAEIAAREAARRAAIAQPARVITERDLPAGKVAATEPLPAKGGARKESASAPRPGAARTDDNGHDERWWTARVDPLLRALDRATRKLEMARARAAGISAAAKRSPATPGGARRLEAAEAEMDRCALEVSTARRALDDLEEEARKAGALPGWLRR